MCPTKRIQKQAIAVDSWWIFWSSSGAVPHGRGSKNGKYRLWSMIFCQQQTDRIQRYEQIAGQVQCFYALMMSSQTVRPPQLWIVKGSLPGAVDRFCPMRALVRTNKNMMMVQ